ncbi:translocation/assembly module TamB domain-containing protein [Lacimicrobium sp. SS2-24]|uniref:translocation/assembly module TamB domain-containing protein n=1 Tax=Lacimicrobium sp. SS2-24 TaxID=2005569 RepID=UPI000B4B5B0B|nr:translocation/assembly module TamB domain-containing protein [Lacimicrobium sp. SS2-24]
MSKRLNLKRWLRWILITLGVLLLLIAAAIFWIGGTQSGSHWALQQARAVVPAFNYQSSSGSLLRGITLTGVTYSDNSITLNVAEVSLDLSARALLLPRLQIQRLVAKGIDATLPESNSPSPEPGTFNGTQKIDLPHWLPPIRVSQLQLQNVSLQTPSLRMSWQQLDAKARLNKARFTLSTLSLLKLHLVLAENSSGETNEGPWPLAALPHMIAPVNTLIEDLRLMQTRIEQPGSDTRIAELKLKLSWLSDKLSIKTLSIDAPAFGTLAMQADATLKHPYPVTLSSTFRPSASLLPENIDRGRWQLLARGDLTRLNTSLTQEKLFILEGQANLTDALLPFEVNWTLQPSPQLLALLPVNIPAEAQLQLIDASGRINGNLKKQILSANLGFSGAGLGPRQPARISLNAEHHSKQLQAIRLKLDDADTGSSLVLSGALNYEQPLQAQLNGDITHLAVDTPLLPYLGHIKGQIQLDGNMSEQQWQLNVHHTELLGSLNNTPLSVSAMGQITQTNDLLSISELNLAGKALGAELNIAGRVDKNWAITGTLTSKDLSLITDTVQGEMATRFNLSGDLKTPTLTTSGNLARLNYQQYQSNDLSFEAQYQHRDNPIVDVQVTAPAIHIDAQRLLHAELSLVGSQNDHQLRVDVGGDLQASASISGSADQSLRQWQGQLQTLSVSAMKEHWQLAERTGIRVTDGQLSIDAHCYKGKFSQICLEQPLRLPETKDILISAEMDYGEWAKQTPGSQRLSGQASLQGKIGLVEQGLPQLDINLTSSAGSLHYVSESEEIALLDWQQGSFALQSQNQQLVLTGELKRADSEPLLNVKMALSDRDSQSVQGRLLLTPIPLQSFKQFVPEFNELKGTLAADIRVSGALYQPKLSGQLLVENTQLRLSANQTGIQDLNLKIDFEGNSTHFTGQFAMGEGSATLQGNSNWDTSKQDWRDALTLEASLQGNALQLQSLPELRATVSPDMQVSFDQHLSLSGRLNIDKGALALTTLPPSATAVSDDMQLVGEQRRQQQAPLCCQMNVDLTIVEPFSVTGFGFQGGIMGALQARKDLETPVQLFGNLSVAQGTYKAYGQNLEVKDGRLQFVGPPKNPMVQLRAIRPLRGTNVEAGIQASGPANNIIVELFSNPVMEQSEILSYLIRGRAPDSESGDGRSMALVMAANQGIDLTSSSGLTEALNEIPLISDISLDTETDAVSGDSMATVSGYIGERIYLKYGVGIVEPVSQVTVRFYLLNQLWLEAVNSLQRSMDLYYSFEVE